MIGQQEEEQIEGQGTDPSPEEVKDQVVEETAAAEEVEDLRRQLEKAQQRAEQLHDQWLRSVAELRNYKRRVQQEQEQRVQEANAVLLGHLLPVVDDFERALSTMPDQKLTQFSWIQGILLIYRRLQAVLEQHGVTPIQAVGEPFDPYFHEAILYEEVPEDQDGVVVAELQKGYMLHERVLRPSLVKVGRGVAEPEPPPPAEGETPAERDAAAVPEENSPTEEAVDGATTSE